MNETAQYWLNKEERTKYAIEHTEYNEQNHLTEIETCYNNSKIYKYKDLNIQKDLLVNKPEIILDNLDTVSAIYKYKDDTKLAALNFASYKNPGGQFINGSNAQEESLCQASFLYNVLKRFQKDYYDQHKITYNGMYTSVGIYSPDILFENIKENKQTTCNIITVAAPNKSLIINYKKGNEQNNSIHLNERIRFLLEIAKLENIETLILGAFGCGVFMQNPKEVADIFNFNINTFNFNLKKVIFAIPDDRFKKNYNEFNKLFGKKEELNA